MLQNPEPSYSSQLEMFCGRETVSSPPYVGLPSLSHQCPVVAVVVVVVEVGGAVVVVVVVFIVVVVLVVVDVDVVVVVVLLQDAKTIDITMRQVIAIQIVPFFISTSLYFIGTFHGINYYQIV